MSFITLDKVQIVGTWIEAREKQAAPSVLLLHMMPATKESWNNFARDLAHHGYSSLAIDLRGHGGSTNQGGVTLNYENFDDAQHQASRIDVDAALDFLEKHKGVTLSRIAVVGASIGANLALQALIQHPTMKTAILLSPGLNYRGLATESLVGRVSLDQSIYIVVSRDDSQSFSDSQVLYDLAQTKKDITLLEGAGHGTNMLERDPSLAQRILSWLHVIMRK